MAMAQTWPNEYPVYNLGCNPLWDLGFQLGESKDQGSSTDSNRNERPQHFDPLDVQLSEAFQGLEVINCWGQGNQFFWAAS